VTRDDILDVLNSHRVLLHYRASTPEAGKQAGPRRYAVFGPGGQLTEPKAHGEAVAEMKGLIADAILGMVP
jgi:hypothetical protein